jgi:RNA polymerase sigma-70 factor (ECF subfamily)
MCTHDTRVSLLQAARSGGDDAWQRLADLYRPFLAGWARRHAPALHDAEDLAQDILLAVLRALPRFEHNGRRGAFRAWLRSVAVSCTHDFWSARCAQPRGTGDSALLASLHELEDPTSGPARAWDREHDAYVLRHLLDQVAVEFELQTMQAFRRLALDGQPAATVTAELKMSAGAAYMAKSRVMQRLRQLAEGLVDWADP